jgi:phosphate:Na+ symporter
MQGLITLEAGIALALGANIGTCVTAGLASIGKPREAIRVATSHVLFKIIGVLIMLPFIEPFAELIISISPSSPASLTGIEATISVLPRQVANAHTLFNVSIAVLFLPFVSQFARIVYWLVPDKPIEEIEEIQPRYLSEMLYHTPSLALDAARHELKRMGKRVDQMNSAMLPAVLNGDKSSLLSIQAMYDEVDILHGHIVTYLAKVSQLKLNDRQTHKLTNLLAAVNDLDHIGDLIEVNMVELGLRRIEKGFKISEPTQKVISTLHVVVSDALKAALRACVDEDRDYAIRVISMKEDLARLVKQAELHQAQRLISEDSGKFEAYSVEVDIIEKLKRMYYHSKRIAKTILESEALEGDVIEAA